MLKNLIHAFNRVDISSLFIILKSFQSALNMMPIKVFFFNTEEEIPLYF